jgi:hypothetical protein
MNLSHLFDNLDAQAAHALGAPVEELQHFYNLLPEHSFHRMTIIIEAALSTDPRHAFRAQRAYRFLRCLLDPIGYTCPCTG